jgi:hypothetical protein
VVDAPSGLSLTPPQETKKLTIVEGQHFKPSETYGGLHESSVLLKANPTDERTPIHVSSKNCDYSNPYTRVETDGATREVSAA